jgi:CDP-glucose 4,6-dehydratase
MALPDPAFWRSRSVLLTGHTGFKGAWLSLWLQALGAHVHGISLGAPTEPSLYELAQVHEGMADSVLGDIRDPSALERAFATARPEIVIHMAAQPLVRRSFAAPRETYEANVMGTVNLLDTVRACEAVRAVVVVTSDKCYAPAHPSRAHREDDPLGGHDPYSSSKAAAELVTAAYRDSFFSGPTAPHVATARAGNVIGGGDWGAERLIPDVVRAATLGETLRLRNPLAIRPWQHVLSPLCGYLVLAQALHESSRYAQAWNFGPDEGDAHSVEWVVRRVSELWPGGAPWDRDEREHPRESPHLMLDSSLARELLGWAPLMSLEQGLFATVSWFRALSEGRDMREITLLQIAVLSARSPHSDM